MGIGKNDIWNQARIGDVIIKNHLVRSATNEHLGDQNGRITNDYIECYKSLAQNGVGLIITSHMAVNPFQKAELTQICLSDEKNLEDLKRLVNTVHACGCKIIAQMSQAGVSAKNIPGQRALTPSGSEGTFEMTETDIEQCVRDYGKAAHVAERAGFDGVQLHLAHGYLLCDFLDPDTNLRQDVYGGCVENRYSIIHRILKEIRKICGAGFLVTVKINTTTKGNIAGFLNDQIKVCKWLEEDGVDAIEISGAEFSQYKQATPYFMEQALKIRKNINIPVMLVGGFRNMHQMQQAMDQGIDFISISRPLICEPDFLVKLEKGGQSKCTNCNQCFKIYKTEYKRCRQHEDIIPQLKVNYSH